jgi:cation:H+ antiporter
VTLPETPLLAALFGGLVIMAIAGDMLVNGALSIARRAGLSPLFAGLFIVGIGASAPEFFVSVNAAANGQTGLAVGNIVGSNIANVFLVLAIPALLLPFKAGGPGQRRALGVLIVATLIWIGISVVRPMDARVGLFLLLIFIGYCGVTLIGGLRAHARGEDHGVRSETRETPRALALPLAWIFVALGVGGLVLASQLIITGGTGVAQHLNVSQEWIGLTLLAVGTSLPEIGAGIAAAVRRKGDMLVGNVLGSSIFNLLAAGGAAALIGPISVARTFPQYDYWAMGLGVVLLTGMIVTRARVGRLTAVFLLLLYAVYIYGLISGFNLLGLFQPTSQ